MLRCSPVNRRSKLVKVDHQSTHHEHDTRGEKRHGKTCQQVQPGDSETEASHHHERSQ